MTGESGQGIITALVQAGGFIAFFIWATQVFIPKREQTFREEMEKERTNYRDSLTKVLESTEKDKGRLFDLIEKTVPPLTEAVNNVARIMAGHDLMMQGFINDQKTANSLVKKEHEIHNTKLDEVLKLQREAAA